MSAQKPVLLLTRPRPAAERFAGLLTQRIGKTARIVLSPLIEIAPLPGAQAPVSASGVIFTSSNAVRIAGAHAIPAYCVGEATTAAACRAGWQASCLGENAAELIAALARSPRPGPLLHLRGRHLRVDIAAELSARGVECADRVIYDQRLLPFTPEAQGLLAGPAPVIAPLFSPRTARQFADAGQPMRETHAVALSKAVAEPLKTRGFTSVTCAAHPTAGAVLDEISPLWNRLSRVEGDRGAQ